MRVLPYPQCCGARAVVEFGHTGIGFGGGQPSKEDLDKFLTKTIEQFRKEKNTFLTCVMNNDQNKLFHDTLLEHGFICVQKDMIHPKYGKKISMYLYTEVYNKQDGNAQPQGPAKTVWAGGDAGGL